MFMSCVRLSTGVSSRSVIRATRAEAQFSSQTENFYPGPFHVQTRYFGILALLAFSVATLPYRIWSALKCSTPRR